MFCNIAELYFVKPGLEVCKLGEINFVINNRNIGIVIDFAVSYLRINHSIDIHKVTSALIIR